MDDAINTRFHDEYTSARRERSTPVLVVAGDYLVVCKDDERTSHLVRPPSFHALKNLAHAPIAAYLALRSGERARQEAVRASLEAIALEDVDQDLRLLVELPRSALLAHLGGAHADPEALAKKTNGALLAATERATRMHLEALAARTDAALAAMTGDERESFLVIVTGDHQARRRSVGMQYFARRLGERDGTEHRVLYAEGVDDVDGALALAATTRLDRDLARAFFDDERRLQRDVLGDAAKKLLDAMKF